MNTALSTGSNSKSRLSRRMVSALFIAAFASALSIFLHEGAHYTAARLVGASDVTFHWAYVDHDLASVSNVSNALIALFGPLFNNLVVALTLLQTRKKPSLFLIALGFAAAFRHIAVLPFTIKSMLGRDTSTFFFDEIRGADALGISPLPLVIVSLIVFFVGTVWFGRKTKQAYGTRFMLLMIVGTLAGVFIWGIIGPVLFPGGHGFN